MQSKKVHIRMKQLKEYIVNENNFFKNLGIGKE